MKSEWRSMDSAPEGARVLLFCSNEGGIFVGGVRRSFQHTYEGNGGTYWNGRDYRPLEWCTHWMPLPEAPAVL